MRRANLGPSGTRGLGRVFGWALLLYPPDFRARFGNGMADAFESKRRALHRASGRAAALRFVLSALVDTALHGWRERRFQREGRWPAHASQDAPRLSALRADLRHVWRRFYTRPAAACVAGGMLALAIGLTTAMFAVIDALLLRPAPFPHADRLAHVVMFGPRGGWGVVRAEVLDAWRGSPGFDAVEGASEATSIVDSGPGPATAQTAFVTPGLFAMLGASPLRGRLFGPADSVSGRDLVVVSEVLWNRAFSRRDDLVGGRISIDGESLRVVGILPQGFRFPAATTEMWRPVDFSAPPPGLAIGRPSAYVRFAPGFPEQEALALATTRARAVDPDLAAQPEVTAQARAVVGASGREYLAQISPYLTGGVVLVFVVLCANVASLFLAQMTGRSLELRTCLALGASPLRLFRQAVTESAALGSAGVVGGMTIAWILVSLARAFLPESLLQQSLNPLDIDIRALGAACVAGFAAVVVAGVVPAWLGIRVEGTSTLTSGERSGTETPLSGRATRTLLVAEIALGCTLLGCAALLVLSFVKLTRIDRGLETSDVVAAWVRLAVPADAPAADRRAAADRLAAELRATPGVEDLTLSYGLPPDGSEIYFGDDWLPDTAGASALDLVAHGYPVAPDFFGFYGIPLLAGRNFEPGDDRFKVVVSEAFAARLWPGENPVGRSYRRGDSQAYEVIGLAREIRYPSLDPYHDVPELYYRYAGAGASVMVSIRCSVDCPDMSRLRQRLLAGPASSINSLRRVEDEYADTLARPRAAAAVGIAFAAIAMVTASGGLFSVLTYAVGRRRREFGIRASLGARPADLRRQVVREGARLVLAGVVIGGFAVWLMARGLQSLTYQVSPFDPSILGGVLAIVVATTVVAMWAPSRRAGRANPVELLRET